MGGLLRKYKSLPVQIRASVWFLFCAFLNKGIIAFTTPIFTRLLTETEFGQYNVFLSWESIISAFVGLNLYYGMFMQGLVKFEADRNRFVSSMQGLSLTLVTAWVVIFTLFQNFWVHLFSLSAVQLLAMLCLIWTGAVFNYWSMRERMELRYRALVAVTILSSLLKPLLGIFLVLHAEDKVTARILGVVAVELCVYTWLFVSHMRQGQTFFDVQYWHYALVFCLPLIPHYLSGSVLGGADRIMISRMVSDSAAGIYSLAYSASHIMGMFSSALLQTIEPWLYKTIRSGVWNRFAEVVYPAMILIAALNVALIAFAPEIVAIFAPPSYYDAIWVVPPVAMSVFFTFSYSCFVSFEFYYEKTFFIAGSTALGAILNVLLNYICIPIWGYYAAGYTTLFCYIIYAAAHYLCMTFISRKERPGIWIYPPGVLLAISGVFMATGFGFMFLYQYFTARYTVALLICFGAWYKRHFIAAYVKSLIALREK